MFARVFPGLLAHVLAAPAQWGLPFRIDEAAVSLTDFGLSLETAILAVILARRPTRRAGLRRWSVTFFGAAAVASLAGAIDHGFLRRDGRELSHDVAWATSLLAIGVSSLAMAGIGASLSLQPRAARRLVAGSMAAFAGYALIVLVAWRDFLVAILAYVPSALYLLAVFVRHAIRRRDRANLMGAAAVLLAFVAAAVQRLEIGVEGLGLDHNALYHLIQAVSFVLFFAAIRALLEGESA